MTIPLAALLDQVPPETRAAVDKARQRFNKAVRQILRDETRLHLSSVVASDNGDDRETRTVQTFVSPGVPEELLAIEFDDSAWLAIELAPLVGPLETARKTADVLYEPIARLSDRAAFQDRFPRANETICQMQDLVTELLREAATFDLLKKIFGINEHVLGRYSYGLSSPNGRVDLYWCVIGLISKMIGVTAEALTVKVLAHELAHAYTHIGADANGMRWDGRAFSQSEPALAEGLAQYYAVRVLDRLERQIPEAKIAYERLLPSQPPAYHAHLPWLNDFKPEEVRDALLTIRRVGVGCVQAFNNALEDARGRLRRE